MKIHLLILVLLGFSKCVLAQAFEDPLEWDTSNRYSISKAAGSTVTRSANSRSGLYAVCLESKYSNILGHTVAGTITTGVLHGTKAYGGQSYSVMSRKLIGYYNYSPTGNDVAGIDVLLSKWNPLMHKKDTIAYGHATLGTVKSFTLFEVLLTYKINMVPDSQLMVISCSQNNTGANAGSKLVIDDVSFSGIAIFTGTTAQSQLPATFIYPNPAQTSFTIRSGSTIEKLIITNSIGEDVYHSIAAFTEPENNIDIPLPEGLYLMQIFYKSGAIEVIKFARAN